MLISRMLLFYFVLFFSSVNLFAQDKVGVQEGEKGTKIENNSSSSSENSGPKILGFFVRGNLAATCHNIFSHNGQEATPDSINKIPVYLHAGVGGGMNIFDFVDFDLRLMYVGALTYYIDNVILPAFMVTMYPLSWLSLGKLLSIGAGFGMSVSLHRAQEREPSNANFEAPGSWSRLPVILTELGSTVWETQGHAIAVAAHADFFVFTPNRPLRKNENLGSLISRNVHLGAGVTYSYHF